MTLVGRDVMEIDALVTDRYLDALLASGEEARSDSRGPGATRQVRRSGGPTLDAAVRLASARLSHDLPRFHPSFRFEERLAVRLAEAAAAMRLPAAAGAEGRITVLPLHPPGLPVDFDPLAEPIPETEDIAILASRPLLVRGAMAASALSLAGAALVAWRRNRMASPMGRAARAAHALRGRPA